MGKSWHGMSAFYVYLRKRHTLLQKFHQVPDIVTERDRVNEGQVKYFRFSRLSFLWPDFACIWPIRYELTLVVVRYDAVSGSTIRYKWSISIGRKSLIPDDQRDSTVIQAGNRVGSGTRLSDRSVFCGSR